MEDKKVKKYSRDKLRKYQKDTKAMADFAKKVSLAKLKGKDLLPDEAWKELQNKLKNRELEEKEMEDILKEYGL